MTCRKAFTLVELLVVVSIIALLISILLPSLSKARESARQTACAAFLHDMGNAQNMYVSDNDGYYAPARGFTNMDSWLALAWYKNKQYRSYMGLDFQGRTGRDYVCPSTTQGCEAWAHSWGFNWTQMDRKTGGSALKSSVTNPAFTAQITDGTRHEFHCGWCWANPQTRWLAHGDHHMGNATHAFAYRHFTGSDSEGGSALFFDNHVDFLTMEQGHPNSWSKRTRLYQIYD